MRAPDMSPSVLETGGIVAGSRSPSVASRSITAGRRNRLARDLHDGVGQSITCLLVDIRLAIERGHATRDDLLLIERQTENVLSALRAVAYQVRRRSSLVDPLGDAQEYAAHLLAASGATLRWIDDRAGRQLSPRVATELGFCIRESITNAMAHGLARLVEVRLVEAESRIRITVRDDGVGFEPESLEPTPEGRGLGLLGTAERMAGISGIFVVRSRPGEGTVIVLDAPRLVARKTARLASTPEPLTVQPELQPVAS